MGAPTFDEGITNLMHLREIDRISQANNKKMGYNPNFEAN